MSCKTRNETQLFLASTSQKLQQQHRSALVLLLCCLVLYPSLVNSFTAAPYYYTTTSTVSSSSSCSRLYGMRSSLRKRLSSLTSRSSPPSPPPPPSVSSPEEEAQPDASSTSTKRVCGTATAVQQQEQEQQSFYSLPPVERRLTKLEQEFRDMLEHFVTYEKRDILSLRDPRMRTLFEGVAASTKEPAVYRAFEVLYDDLLPLRMAGRLIFGKLQKLMEDSLRERQQEVDCIVDRTGLAAQDVEDTRLDFVTVASNLNGDAFLTLGQLKQTGLAETALHVLLFDSVDAFLQRLDTNQQGKLTFEQLMIGMQECSEEMCAVEACNPAAVMQEIMIELKDHPPAATKDLDKRKQRFSERYDEMLAAFREWEDLVPEGHGRRLEVVRGCFVGAKNQQVVDALRIVYVDLGVFRMAGDIIFKLVSSVMKGRLRAKIRSEG